MGVTCVSQMPVAEGKSVQQTVELLTRKLETLGAEKQGTFCVDCETYHTAASTLGSQALFDLSPAHEGQGHQQCNETESPTVTHRASGGDFMGCPVMVTEPCASCCSAGLRTKQL
ncbi:hypothetical protein GHT09_010604 [Marmota monax]|uniref:Mediator of RNA polymerase II transcription subunit 20 n=1 Tax=Marmota monax TaxID=9995 RepID=A0A834PNW2_MARMO|nr:hypothetical protein GHT09_010604 [Marmota monax]